MSNWSIAPISPAITTFPDARIRTRVQRMALSLSRSSASLLARSSTVQPSTLIASYLRLRSARRLYSVLSVDRPPPGPQPAAPAQPREPDRPRGWCLGRVDFHWCGP